MALPRHIYRSKKLSNIPQKRYSRKYNPDYLLEKASYGASIKQGFGDFDGDGDLDGMYPKQRAGVAEKPGLHINEPRRGPRNLISFGLPAYGPINLRVPTPESGPLSLEFSVDPPQLGPTSLNTTIQASSFGPASLNASILAPAAGPLNLSITRNPAAGPSNLSSIVQEPQAGPSSLQFILPPVEGPISLNTSVIQPTTVTLQPWREAGGGNTGGGYQPAYGVPQGGSPPFYGTGDPESNSYNQNGNFIYTAQAPAFAMVQNTGFGSTPGYTRFNFYMWQTNIPGVLNRNSTLLRSEGPWPSSGGSFTAKPIYIHDG